VLAQKHSIYQRIYFDEFFGYASGRSGDKPVKHKRLKSDEEYKKWGEKLFENQRLFRNWILNIFIQDGFVIKTNPSWDPNLYSANKDGTTMFMRFFGFSCTMNMPQAVTMLEKFGNNSASMLLVQTYKRVWEERKK